MTKKSHVVSQNTIFQSKLFSVQETVLASDTGETRIHHDVMRDPTVSVVVLADDYTLYMIKQYRPLFGREILENVAGFIDPGEDPLTAAKRELHEEVGIVAASWQKLAEVEMAASVIQATSHIFLARDVTVGKASPEENEEITLVTLPLEEAVQKVISGEIKTGTSMQGILLVDRLKREGKV